VGLNLIVIRDTQSSRNRFSWAGGGFFLTFCFKEAFSNKVGNSVVSAALAGVKTNDTGNSVRASTSKCSL
jgi:hypothetical protein